MNCDPVMYIHILNKLICVIYDTCFICVMTPVSFTALIITPFITKTDLGGSTSRSRTTKPPLSALQHSFEKGNLSPGILCWTRNSFQNSMNGSISENFFQLTRPVWFISAPKCLFYISRNSHLKRRIFRRFLQNIFFCFFLLVFVFLCVFLQSIDWWLKFIDSSIFATEKFLRRQ